MSNEKPKENSYQSLKDAIIEMVREFPNDQILGSKIRNFSRNLEEKDTILSIEDIKEFPL